MPADERKRRTIMDRQNLFNFLAKDASKPEGRGTVLTMWGVYKKGVRLRRPDTFSNGSLLDKRSDLWPSSMMGVRKS